MAGKIPFTDFIAMNQDGSEVVLTAQDLKKFAEPFGIPQMISGRYSDLLLLDLYTSEKNLGLSPEHVAQEISALENRNSSFMKPPSQFIKKPLKGLWHKHFLIPTLSSIAHNIMNELGKNGVRRAANDSFHPSKGKILTKDMLRDFASQVVDEPIQTRSNEARLTGEWLIYAKHNHQNYYLCIANHKVGMESSDHYIADRLRTVCCREFEWLSDILNG